MPRYIEQLNECTDPADADFAWIVDSSAGATDKDRKLSLSRLLKLGQTNTVPASAVTIVDGASGQDILRLRTAASANALVLNSSGVLTQPDIITRVRFVSGYGGSTILASEFGDVPTTGELHAVETGTGNYLIATFYKRGTSNTAVVTVQASSVLTLGAANSGGTQVISNATVDANVRMMSIIRKSYV